MKHKELLAKINSKLDKCTCDGWNNNCFDDDNLPWLILRAVVELHKPDPDSCPCCGPVLDVCGVEYPCPTIQAIQGVLQ